MVNFVDKIKRAAGYCDTNFFDAEAIGVIARGPSNVRVDLCSNEFSHCFLAGEFNHTLDKIGSYLKGKDIVLSIMQAGRYRTPKEKCIEYGIKNLQVHRQENSKAFRKIKEKYPDLKVVGYTKEHYDLGCKIFTYGSKRIGSTGIGGIFNALFFRPKRIFIAGIDFYNQTQVQYAVSEDHDMVDENSLERNAKTFQEVMQANLYQMAEVFPEIDFHLFTTFGKVEDKRNLKVYKV